MSEQQQMFDPTTTVPPRCTACGATKKNLCAHDADLEHGLASPTRKRPKSCLNAYDPKTARIPF